MERAGLGAGRQALKHINKGQNEKMNRIIKVLDDSHLIRFTNWVDEEDGHMNPVFIAEFEHPSGRMNAFCKLYNPASKGLINEITGFLIARSYGIPQPQHAFLLFLSAAKLPRVGDIAERYGNEWMKGKPHFQIFCTSRLDGQNAALYFRRNGLLPEMLAEEVQQWRGYAPTVALDEHIAHTDRHSNNLLRLGKRKYAIIDNGRLVSEKGENWGTSELCNNRNYPNLLWDWVGGKDCQGRAIVSAEHHESEFKKIEPELVFWQNQLLPNPQENLSFRDFLQYRARETPCLLKNRFGLI